MVGSYVVAYSDQALIGTLSGYQFQSTMARKGLLSGTFNFGRHTGSHLRRGIACGGLLPPPPACPVETLRDETTAIDIGATLDVRLFQRVFGAPIEGTGSVGAQVLHVENVSRGQTTGDGIGAKGTKLGPTLGFDLSAQPKAALPIGLRLGVVGGVFSETDSGILDGYTPFDAGFTFTRFELGLVWFLQR